MTGQFGLTLYNTYILSLIEILYCREMKREKCLIKYATPKRLLCKTTCARGSWPVIIRPLLFVTQHSDLLLNCFVAQLLIRKNRPCVISYFDANNYLYIKVRITINQIHILFCSKLP